MKVIDRIKDSNLSLVHNSRLTEEMMKFERQELDEVKKKMYLEISINSVTKNNCKTSLLSFLELIKKVTSFENKIYLSSQ